MEVIGHVVYRHYIKKEELLTEIEKHKKILIIAPRRSGKTRFLQDYCNLGKHDDKMIFYYSLTRRGAIEFSNGIKRNIHIGNTKYTEKGREVHNMSDIVILDESFFMDIHVLSNYLKDDTHIISISTIYNVDRDEVEELHKKNGFHIVYVQCDCDNNNNNNKKQCRWSNRCIYCGINYEKDWKRCPYCLYDGLNCVIK